MAGLGRIDYTKWNYCSGCELFYLKPINKCSDCHQKLRTRTTNYGKRFKSNKEYARY